MSGDRGSRFARRNRMAWRRFREAATAHASGRSLPPEAVIPFARDYRDVAADLSAARSLGCSREVIHDLNAVVSLGHGVVYRRRIRPPGIGMAERFARWVIVGFPAALWRHRRIFALVLALFLVPALLGWSWVRERPQRILAVFPSLDAVIRPDGPSGGGSINPMPAFFSSYLMWNNIRVAFLSFAAGLLAGVGTAYILVVNGMILGALAAHFAAAGMLPRFWPQVLPHGITEILAILVAATAGLLAGRAIWRPGPWSRVDALARAGREAATMLGMSALLLIYSGLVESWVTRSLTDDGVRNGFAFVMAVVTGLWLGHGMLRARTADAAAAATDAARA